MILSIIQGLHHSQTKGVKQNKANKQKETVSRGYQHQRKHTYKTV